MLLIHKAQNVIINMSRKKEILPMNENERKEKRNARN